MTGKPLTVTLAEAVQQHPMLALISDRERQLPRVNRPSPPSSRATLPPPRAHALPPPSGPDRSLVAPPEEREMAAKKRARRAWSEADKAKAAARVLGGKEPQKAVAAELGITQGLMSRWVAEAKKKANYAERQKKRLATLRAKRTAKTNGASPAPAAGALPTGIAALAAELARLEAEAAAVKRKLILALGGGA